MAKEPTPQMMAMDVLRAAADVMRSRAPGKPAVKIPLDRIYTFHGDDGEAQAVIGVEEVIYLADSILRGAK